VTPLVVDASALVEYLFRTPRGITLAPLIETRGVDLHVPALADIEFASAVVRLLVRRIVSTDRATEALGDLADLPLTRHGHLALLPRILSLRGNFSVYDGVYVALAESLAAGLITADEKLVTAVGAHTTVRIAR
jgi:predicted nucleic acid-binding protein